MLFRSVGDRVRVGPRTAGASAIDGLADVAFSVGNGVDVGP